ncbi:MAG: TerB family tellurite resistance protein [Deltaproteobacteria bacterium]|nr:TerB family tellurite resistance protein [Deltaproteobacteria bacterium]
MINRLKKFFMKTDTRGTNSANETASHDIRVATCALLLEISNIDGEFSEPERGLIMDTLKTDYGLDHQNTMSLMEAAEQELHNSTDLWQFTELINQNFSIEEKIGIIEMVWRIAYTDQILDKHEDYLLHKLAKLLHLSHNKLIDAKLKVIRG